jgi:hypothetical protein
MLKKIILFNSLFSVFFSLLSQDLTVDPNNSGYSSYDAGTGKIHDLHFRVLNNDGGEASKFYISLQLISTLDSLRRIEILGIEVTSGQPSHSSIDYFFDVVDINNTTDIASGQYFLVVKVDATHLVPEVREDNNVLSFLKNGNFLTYWNASAGISPVGKMTREFKLYPNPTKDHVFLEQSSDKKEVFFKLYDITGKIAKEIEIKQQLTKIDLSGLREGVYIYKLLDFNGQIVRTGKVIRD